MNTLRSGGIVVGVDESGTRRPGREVGRGKRPSRGVRCGSCVPCCPCRTVAASRGTRSSPDLHVPCG